MNIYDIAKKANVSIATVSRVLNGSDKVSQKTKDTVLSVIKHNNYVPSALAQNLSMQNSLKNIGMVCHNLDDIFFAKAVSLLERPLREANYNIILTSTGSELDEKIRSVDLLLSKQVDALILIGSVFVNEHDNNAYIKNVAAKIPVLIINGKVDGDNIFCYYCHDRAAVKNVVVELSQTRKHILYLYDAVTSSGNMKLAGFTDGMHQAGYDSDGRMLKVGSAPREAAEAFARYLDSQKPVDAVLTANDALAAGVLSVARARNLRIPQDIAVVGYNNSVLSECTAPILSSIDNRVEEMCACAIESLIGLFSGENVPKFVGFDATLNRRESY